MPTARPRITITLTTRQHEVLTRLSAAGGDSMSEIVASFVELAVPSLERVVLVLERAKAAPQEVRAGLSAALGRADRVLMPAIQAALDQQDLFFTDLTSATDPAGPPAFRVDAERPPEGGGPGRRAKTGPGGAKGVSTPVPVTRGSGRSVAAKKGVRRGAV